MKRFFIRCFLYSIPLIIIISLIALTDPYYLFHKSRPFDQDKFDIGYSYDQGRRYKLFTFLNKPTDKIILGASEINPINERNIPEGGWHSLSFGGVQLEESLDLFWGIARNNSLTTVMLAPEFIKFCIAVADGDMQYYNWSQTESKRVMDLFESPLDIFVDKYTIQSTYYYLLSKLGVENTRSKPTKTRDAFWEEQCRYGIDKYTSKKDSTRIEKIYNEFDRISHFCANNDIKVIIVLPIQHADLIKVEFSDEVYPLYRDYLSHLIGIFGSVYYYDYPNELSCDPALFSDPFHYVDANVYLNSIWGSDLRYMKKLESNESLTWVDSIRENYSFQ